MPTSKGTVPADSMNTHAIGIEAANNGVGQSWPQEQIDAYFMINNALAAAYGLRPNDCATHNAYAPDRKIDPATAAAVEGPWRPQGINTSGTWNVFDVQDEATSRAMPDPTPTPPTPPQEDDQMLYYKVKGANAKFIGNGVVVRWTGPGSTAMDSALNVQLANGNLVAYDLSGGPFGFVNAWLDGPLPTGDSLYEWTGDEFANSEQIKAGQS
jgi:hypothetical protein